MAYFPPKCSCAQAGHLDVNVGNKDTKLDGAQEAGLPSRNAPDWLMPLSMWDNINLYKGAALQGWQYCPCKISMCSCPHVH